MVNFTLAISFTSSIFNIFTYFKNYMTLEGVGLTSSSWCEEDCLQHEAKHSELHSETALGFHHPILFPLFRMQKRFS